MKWSQFVDYLTSLLHFSKLKQFMALVQNYVPTVVKRSCHLSPVIRAMLPIIKLWETLHTKKSLSTLPVFEFIWFPSGKWDPLTSGGEALTANREKLIDKVQNMRARARDRNLCGLRATTAENKKEVKEARRRSALAVGFVRLGRWSGSIEPRKTNNSEIGATASDLRGLAGSTAWGGRCFLWWRHRGLKRAAILDVCECAAADGAAGSTPANTLRRQTGRRDGREEGWR